MCRCNVALGEAKVFLGHLKRAEKDLLFLDKAAAAALEGSREVLAAPLPQPEGPAAGKMESIGGAEFSPDAMAQVGGRRGNAAGQAAAIQRPHQPGRQAGPKVGCVPPPLPADQGAAQRHHAGRGVCASGAVDRQLQRAGGAPLSFPFWA